MGVKTSYRNVLCLKIRLSKKKIRNFNSKVTEDQTEQKLRSVVRIETKGVTQKIAKNNETSKREKEINNLILHESVVRETKIRQTPNN